MLKVAVSDLTLSWQKLKHNIPIFLLTWGISNMVVSFVNYSLGMISVICHYIPNSDAPMAVLLFSSINSYVFEFGALIFCIGFLLFINQKFKELKKK